MEAHDQLNMDINLLHQTIDRILRYFFERCLMIGKNWRHTTSSVYVIKTHITRVQIEIMLSIEFNWIKPTGNNWCNVSHILKIVKSDQNA